MTICPMAAVHISHRIWLHPFHLIPSGCYRDPLYDCLMLSMEKSLNLRKPDYCVTGV